MLKEYALHYYGQGYNCAESLVWGEYGVESEFR